MLETAIKNSYLPLFDGERTIERSTQAELVVIIDTVRTLFHYLLDEPWICIEDLTWVCYVVNFRSFFFREALVLFLVDHTEPYGLSMTDGKSPIYGFFLNFVSHTIGTYKIWIHLICYWDYHCRLRAFCFKRIRLEQKYIERKNKIFTRKIITPKTKSKEVTRY